MNLGLIVFYVFNLIGLLIAANLHGKKKEGDNNFWISLIGTIIILFLVWWALGWRFI